MSCDCTGTIADFFSDNLYTWCTGCGNYGIVNAMKKAMVEKNLKPHDVLLCFDVGCNGNASDKIKAFGFHGLHGRVLPFAAGASIGNPNLPIIATAGDGATLSEGINHFVHAIRSNYNITFILHNNNNYALTTGQASTTTKQGKKMNTTPEGVTEEPLNPSLLALQLGAGFVARGFSGDINQLTGLIKSAMDYKGFAMVEVIQTCPSYNYEQGNNYWWERVYSLSDTYVPTEISSAMTIASEMQDRIATGVLYQKEKGDFLSRQTTKIDYDDSPERQDSLVAKMADNFR